MNVLQVGDCMTVSSCAGLRPAAVVPHIDLASIVLRRPSAGSSCFRPISSYAVLPLAAVDPHYPEAEAEAETEAEAGAQAG